MLSEENAAAKKSHACGEKLQYLIMKMKLDFDNNANPAAHCSVVSFYSNSVSQLLQFTFVLSYHPKFKLHNHLRYSTFMYWNTYDMFNFTIRGIWVILNTRKYWILHLKHGLCPPIHWVRQSSGAFSQCQQPCPILYLLFSKATNNPI